MKKFFFLCLMILFVTMQLKSQWNQVSHPLLQGADHSRMIIHDNSVFAFTSAGIFKTSDQGQSWTYLNNGIDTVTNTYNAMGIINNSIYIQKSMSRNLLKYENNNWTEINPIGFPNDGYNWNFGSANNKLYMFFYDVNKSSTYIYYSSNGINWNEGVSLGSQDNNTEFLHLSNSKQFFTYKDSLYYTINGTEKVKIPYPNGMQAYDFYDGRLYGEYTGDYIFLNTQGSFYRMNINTTPLVWEDITSNITTLPNVFIPEVAVTNGAIFATAIKSLTEMTLLRSSDHGNTFTEIDIPNSGLDMPIIGNVIALSPGVLLAQDMSNHVYYSNNNGNTWEKRDNGLLGITSFELTNINGVLYNRFSTDGTTVSIIKSTDKGATWTPFNEGLPEFGKPLFKESLIFISELFKNDITPYVIANDMVDFNDVPYIYRLDSINNKWVKTIAQPGLNPRRISHLGNNKTTFFISFESQGNEPVIMRTTNAGQSWTDINAGLTGFNFQEIYEITGKGVTDTLLLFGRDNNGTDIIIYSTNNGDNWFNLYNVSMGRLKITNEYTDNPKAVYAFGGSKKSFMIAITDWGMFGENDRLYILKDGSLRIINTTGLPNNLHINSINYIGNTWYLGTTIGIFKSANGINWSSINNNNYYLGMKTIKIHFIQPYLIIGTNNGIWRNDIITGIDYKENNEYVNVYPNPVNDILNIDLKSNDKNTCIDVYSIMGEKLHSEITNNRHHKIDLSSFNNGIYMLVIKQGLNTYTKKIVK